MFGSGEILSYITLFDFDLIKMTWNIHDKSNEWLFFFMQNTVRLTQSFILESILYTMA